MKIEPLSLEDAEYIAHRYCVERLNFTDEPMPDFKTRKPGKLESCLAQPFHTFDGKALYRTFAQKSAVLFYVVSKGHCFSNGNKRMAVTLTSVFCFVNSRWLEIPNKVLYDISNEVAESDSKDMDELIKRLTKIFKENIVPLT